MYIMLMNRKWIYDYVARVAVTWLVLPDRGVFIFRGAGGGGGIHSNERFLEVFSWELRSVVQPSTLLSLYIY